MQTQISSLPQKSPAKDKLMFDAGRSGKSTMMQFLLLFVHPYFGNDGVDDLKFGTISIKPQSSYHYSHLTFFLIWLPTLNDFMPRKTKVITNDVILKG